MKILNSPLNKIKLSDLPSVYLLNKDQLPNCAAIYFVADSKGQILYIGRTVNLLERWREHHRFNQLKRFNRKDRVTISWLFCSNDITTLSKLETARRFLRCDRSNLSTEWHLAPEPTISLGAAA